jgi:hypothetical protein
MTMTVIGYGQYRYTVKSSPAPVTWPVLGIALQKNYLSFYSSVYRDDSPFSCAYAGRLGRARVSPTHIIEISFHNFGETLRRHTCRSRNVLAGC